MEVGVGKERLGGKSPTKQCKRFFHGWIAESPDIAVIVHFWSDVVRVKTDHHRMNLELYKEAIIYPVFLEMVSLEV